MASSTTAKQSYRLHMIATFMLGFGLGIFPSSPLLAQSAHTTQKPIASAPLQPILARHYHKGEMLHYEMQGTNQEYLKTIRYDVEAEGSVKENPSGIFFEEFRWSGLHVDNIAIPLSQASQQFRQYLSLSRRYKLSIPDLSKVQPMLIGPIADLLTFYADVQLAMNQPALVRAGDHVYVQRGIPNSWADGSYTILGQDAIDFDITLESIDDEHHVATLVIRHVPPVHPQIKLSAEWMRSPVSDTANNWVEVEKSSDGKYVAEVGKEIFVDAVKISLPSGKIVSASMDNPVDVRERTCSNSALTICGASSRYQIRRQIMLNEN